jgi:FkbM family methyltransferase
MTFVSYAQNFEDVLLWRALRHVPAGFYIDVGASHPDVDSVTRAFSERGWHGINIEPVPEGAARIAAARPDDLTLQLAVGRDEGEADFFTVPGTGLSTLDPAVADAYRDPAWDLCAGRIAVRTLAGLCRAHVRGEIHFLKIDVEGAEAEVLAGADLIAYRPWIILVEATAPLSAEPTHAAWEPGLLERGYRFAWFDGLNRFYLADERADALSVHFRTPPNVFDDFIRAADTVLAGRIAAAEARAVTLEGALATGGQRAAEAAARADLRIDLAGYEIARLQQALGDACRAAAARKRALQAKLARIRHERHLALHEVQRTHLRLQAALRESHEHARALEQTAQALVQTRQAFEQNLSTLRESEAWLAAIRRSTSWRLTGPVRVALRQLRRTPARAVPPAASLPEPPAPPPVAAQPAAPPASQSAVAAIAVPPAEATEVLSPPPATKPLPGRHRRCVHQFHSGSAVADAITNAMLLTRTILRGLGYESEIFVTHLDPELAHELRPIDALPLHDDYVLIVRHSIGHDEFDRVAALPAPKILIYHNITPPDLLTRHPVLAAYAELGRRQLAVLPGHVHAALADSDFTAIELHQLGFEPVRSCAVLFDIAQIRARAAQMLIMRGDVFTILFIGRICQSKAQIELIDAYAAFRTRYHAPARLVLVGRHETDTDPYLQALRRRVTCSAHPDEILLTGLVSDAERDAWYGRADLYVSFSRHEGFGVPLIEAMAHGVPVLARPSGAVPYTLGGAACLLPEDAGAAQAGALLHALAADPQRRATQAAAQLRSLDRFALPGQTAILLQALLRAGAALPPGPREALDANLHFAVAGHVNKTYSLAAVNRSLALELEAARPGRVRLIPVEGVVTTDLSEVPAESRRAIALLAQRPAPLSAPELIVSQHYPVHVPPRVEGQIRLALLFWEESLLPAETIATLEAGFDGVVAPTGFVARALQDSGLRLPVRVIAPPPLSGRSPRRAPHEPLSFLHVSSCFPRKGVDILLRAWAAAFTASDPVRLLIKSFANPHNSVADDLADLHRSHPDLAPVTLIEQDLDAAALAGLYARSDVMVLPSRGEGYNLPAAEALAAGLRLIVTGAGGHMDFCRPDDPRIRLLRYRHGVSASHLATPSSLWFEPDPDDLAAALREALERPGPVQAPAPEPQLAPRADALARFGLDLLLRPPDGQIRIAWVSSWHQRCGVAEYSRLMLDALEPDPAVSITVLCDHRTPSYAPLPGWLPHIPCWNAGSDCVDELLHAIARSDAHAVAVQHQPGLVAWRGLVRLIDGVLAQGRVLTVTLHNSRDLLDQPPDDREALLAALARADRIVVHTVADLDRLAGLGLTQRVALFPQGVPAPLPPPAPRELDRADAPIIGCYGFFLPGKGIDTLIEAACRLRERWPGLQLRLVNAAYGGADSDAEIARARSLAEPLREQVQFHIDFLPHDRSLALLTGCDVIVLPYRPSKEASSAALRTALTASVPVAVSSIALFDEADDAVLRVDADNAEALARDIDAMLCDVALRRRLQRSAAEWMGARAWPPIVRRFTGMLVGLANTRA